MIDERFFVPRTPIAVIAVGDSGEALLLRMLLENIGAAVRLHLIGTPQDLLLALKKGPDTPRYLIVSAHGEEDGLSMGAFGPNIDTALLKNGSLPAAALTGRIDLSDKFVLSTACGTGGLGFQKAFREGGVAAYAAPNAYPSGAEAVLFAHVLFYNLLKCKLGWGEAFELTKAALPDLTGDWRCAS